MTLNKHQIQGLPNFTSTILDASTFELLMVGAGYSKSGSAPAKGNRVKVWWIHNQFPRVESIYSPDKQIVITGYHV